MIFLTPMPKKTEEIGGTVSLKKIKVTDFPIEPRIKAALLKLPCGEGGIPLKLDIGNQNSEKYLLKIDNFEISLKAEGERGAFYGIQTLRQLMQADEIPCIIIEDEPDFPYRGFYHDVTRGKVLTVETAKKLIDTMAYYKLNMLQFYVEHTFEFKEYSDSLEKTGYLTAAEIKEIDDYCYENFIEFVPSLSTFGHLYELLQKDKYKHLCEIENYEPKEIFWYNRMSHHTIDPTLEESFSLIKSLIDQYLPNFRTDKFNICCDETFDLKVGKHSELNSGELYINFVNQIVTYLTGCGKKVMMWGDVLLEHPEVIEKLPSGVEFLHWDYEKLPDEERVKTIANTGKNYFVCPGTNTWSRFSECIEIEKENINHMIEYGKLHGAEGVLNTNWGDWGNPCSLELSLFGMVFGAAKSWNVLTKADESFEKCVNFLLYENERGLEYVTRLSRMEKLKGWEVFAKYYSNIIYENKLVNEIPTESEVLKVQAECGKIVRELQEEIWINDEFRQEIILAAEGVCLTHELISAAEGYNVKRTVDTKAWLRKYRIKWLEKNKESELAEIEKVFLYMEEYTCGKNKI